MKRIRSLLLQLVLLCLLLQGCKKDKAETSPPPDPIAVYKFDDDWATNSASSFLHGQVIDNISSSLDSFLVPFRCFLFKGDGYVSVKDSDLIDFPNNQFTLAAWIKPTKAQHTYVIAKNEDANYDSPYSLDIHPGVVRAFVRTNTKEQFLIEGKTPIIQGAWQHIAATFTGEELIIYYNGNKEGSIAVDRPLGVTKGDMGIGTSISHYPSSAFQGSIDNVKIFDKALTAAQLKNLYLHYKD
jgi:hypothetical protein